MARQRVIVGIGEAGLLEHADGEEPEGLALCVPIAAAMLGHRGVAISRLGQDVAAGELVNRPRATGVDVEHLQSDPDLATARTLVTRPDRGPRDDDGALVAWDLLQWDFDLADVAQDADGVVFSALGRRNGQARSTSDRFLAECRRAVRLYDLTRRPPGNLDRSRSLATLHAVEAAIVDDAALGNLLPGQPGAEPADGLAGLVRQCGLSFAVRCQPGQPLIVQTPEGSWRGEAPYVAAQHEIMVVGILHGAIAGWSWPETIALSERLAVHAAEHPHEKPSDVLLRRA
jgi:hypothetical protein